MTNKFNIEEVSGSFSKVLNEANFIISSKVLSDEEIESIRCLKNMADMFIEKYPDRNIGKKSIWNNLIENYIRDLLECR